VRELKSKSFTWEEYLTRWVNSKSVIVVSIAHKAKTEFDNAEWMLFYRERV
jgi:hypothetical protein